MRKKKKELAIQLLEGIRMAYGEISNYISNPAKIENRQDSTRNLLAECQKAAINIGNLIEAEEGEGTSTVGLLESFCELLYEMDQAICEDDSLAYIKKNEISNKFIIKIKNSILHDIPETREIVFLPYKASMWDSFESVWKASCEDKNNKVYVIPIPYYEKNQDGSFAKMHWEGEDFPDYVSITKYDEYDFGIHHPDIVFIHNPYDAANYVTSVHPFFYSDKLRKITDCLVYIPYFATAGGMNKVRSWCPVYEHVDYIVIQSEEYRKYYASIVPDDKFLAFGSPKFDSVIRKCSDAVNAPEAWKERMQGKKVVFYNTSLGGMLANTHIFILKMQYVFEMARKNSNICLVWRPHPLFDATLHSMRPEYENFYLNLKDEFINDGYGILDQTPDVGNTISLCDAYIGDSASSIVSLFGVVGKPIFILNNSLIDRPHDDDWKNEVLGTCATIDNEFVISNQNKLFYSVKGNFKYRYLCDLTEMHGRGHYQGVIKKGNRQFFVPVHQHVLIERNTEGELIKHEISSDCNGPGAYKGYFDSEKYLFIMPLHNEKMVVYEYETGTFLYVSGIQEINTAYVDGQLISLGSWLWNEKLYIIDNTGTKLVIIDCNGLDIKIKSVEIGEIIYRASVDKVSGNAWLFPYEGTAVYCMNCTSLQVHKYEIKIDELKSFDRVSGELCEKKYFSSCAVVGENVYIAPYWGNHFLKLNIANEKVTIWENVVDTSAQQISPYVKNLLVGSFYSINEKYYFWNNSRQALYRLDDVTESLYKVNVVVDKDDIEKNKAGFADDSVWLRYCCIEDETNTLEDFFNDNIHGNKHNYQEQISSYERINASVNGDCGTRVYKFLTKDVSNS